MQITGSLSSPARAGENARDRDTLRLSGSGLECVRGGRLVFAQLDFALGAGEILALQGPNGAGKSSLLRVVAGLLQPTAGRIVLDGGDPELTIGEQAHYLGHRDAFKPSLSVTENLQFWARFLGGEEIETAAALDAVGLGGVADLPAGYLSAGQRRRLSLARLIAVRRPVWLLDEPTSALDAAGQERLAALMETHLSAGGMIMAATHGALGIAATHVLMLGDAAPRAMHDLPADAFQ